MVANRTIALVSFIPEGGGLVTWTPNALAALGRAVRSIDTSTVDAVAFTGAGAAFGTGADLDGFGSAASPADGERIASKGYAALAEITRIGVPTFAFINGTALGGALELALRTDFRTIAATARNIGLPEVRLGLVPGWGGIASLGALVGITAAADLIITRSLAGRHLSAVEARDGGVADVLLGDEDFVSASLAWAARVLDGHEVPHEHEPQRSESDSATWHPDAVRQAVARRIPGTLPAVDAALGLLSAWRTRSLTDSAALGDAGRTARRLRLRSDLIEPETVTAFGLLLDSDECRASIYAFFALQAARKRSRPRRNRGTATKVGVVGGGLMATQLALVFAERLDAPTLITDLSQERVDLALERVTDQLERAAKRGNLAASERDRVAGLVAGTTDVADYAERDVVIEAVFEDLAVKRSVWASVERVVSRDTLLLTNTSSLSIEDQGAQLRHPERLIGFHFFNPVAVLPLVEIVQSPETSPETVDAAFALAGALGKTAVLVKDSPGFVVNRLLTRLFSDALALIDAGTDAHAVDTALVRDGLPMTPLALLGYIGPAVQLHILETMHLGYADRFTVSPSLRRVVELGLPGYLDRDGRLSPEATAVIEGVLAAGTRRVVLSDPDTIRGLLLRGLADETWRMLAEGTVLGAADIDACMILGANFPHHTGGLTPLLDRSGASLAANGVLFHQPGILSTTELP